MWTSILINIGISILIIMICHYLWNHFVETYSDKVTKDILGSQTQKYKAIIDDLQKNQQYNSFMTNPIEDEDTTDVLIADLKNDLEQFLHENIDENK